MIGRARRARSPGGRDGRVHGASEVPTGVVAVMLVALSTVKLAALVEPKLTELVPMDPVPVIETEVPPELGPELGLTAVTAGPGGGEPAVMFTFWTSWMSLNPPVPAVNPIST